MHYYTPPPFQDYREGMQFADLEIDLPRRRTFNDRREEGPLPVPINDGSGPRGKSGAMGLGYGAHPASADGPPDPQDAFGQYRSMRSGAYYNLIHRNAAKRGS